MRYWCLQPATSFSINSAPQHRYVPNLNHKHVYVHHGIKLSRTYILNCNIYYSTRTYMRNYILKYSIIAIETFLQYRTTVSLYYFLASSFYDTFFFYHFVFESMNENLFVYRQFLYFQEYKIHDMNYIKYRYAYATRQSYKYM